MSDLFDPFLFRRQEHDALDGYRSNTMTIAAKQILLTSRESDEAYLGAIAVLMLNGAV